MLSRRQFVTALGTSLFARAAPSFAQQSTPRVPLVAFIGLDSGNSHRFEAFREGLRDRGYREGVNIQLAAPNLDDRYERMAEAVSELVRRNVRVIVTWGSTATNAARKAAAAVPIVMVSGIDPVKAGFADSLAHPGGNITGVLLESQNLTAKRLEILKDILPGLVRVGLLVNPDSRGSTTSVMEVQSAATVLRLELQKAEVRASTEFEAAFAQLVKANVGAVYVTPSTMFAADRARIAALATKNRLPAIFSGNDFADAGGLVSYGTDGRDAFRRAAGYVDKILKGAKPSDLAIEQPTKFELVINLRAAKEIGVQIPQQMVLRADRLIE